MPPGAHKNRQGGRYPISICQFFVEEAKNRKRINVHDLVVFLQYGHFETSNLIDLFDLLYHPTDSDRSERVPIYP